MHVYPLRFCTVTGQLVLLPLIQDKKVIVVNREGMYFPKNIYHRLCFKATDTCVPPQSSIRNTDSNFISYKENGHTKNNQ